MDYLSEVMRAAVWGERPPDAPIWIQWIHRNLSENHCPECLKLDECWFAEEKTPRWPHHPYCHCVMESVPYSDVLTHSRPTARIQNLIRICLIQRIYINTKRIKHLKVGVIRLKIPVGCKTKSPSRGWRNTEPGNMLWDS